MSWIKNIAAGLFGQICDSDLNMLPILYYLMQKLLNDLFMELQENEIIVGAQRVKYRSIEYNDNFVTIEQNRTRRRIYNGYFFEDNGEEIYISTFFSDIFQHQKKIRRFIVNKVTKEWRDFQYVVKQDFIPDKMDPVKSNEVAELKK